MSESINKKTPRYTYKDSGVDINKANNMLSGLKNIIEATHDKNVLSSLASFCGLFRLDTAEYKEPVLTSSTDGVGTKLILAKQTGNYHGIGYDLVAMSINDLICSGAKPLFFLDYIACGHIDPEKISDIIRSVADACKYCNTALIGGETAEMPDMYKGNDVDLAGFAVGIVDKDKILRPGLVEKGDLVIGLLSSGLHSNGFSLIRKVVEANNLDINKPLDWTEGKSLGDVLLAPTKLYSPLIGQILGNNKIKVKGIANITGGGFYDNINRIIGSNMDAVIHKDRWEVPAVFKALKELGNIPGKEMFHVFNMGIGMTAIISPESLKELESTAREINEDIVMLGEIADGTGIVQIK